MISSASTAGRPKRIWIADSSRFSTALYSPAEHRLERRDHVADDVFRRVVQQRCEPVADVDARYLLAHHGFDQQRVLRHREDVRARGLAVPARHPRQSMRDVDDLDVER